MTYYNQKVANSPLGSFGVASDRIDGSGDFQRIKLDVGNEDETSPVTRSNPLPVTILPSNATSVAVAQVTVGVTTGSTIISSNTLALKSSYFVNVSDTTIYVSWNSPATTSDIPVLPGGTFQFTAYFGGPLFDASLYGIHGGVGTKNIKLIKISF